MTTTYPLAYGRWLPAPVSCKNKITKCGGICKNDVKKIREIFAAKYFASGNKKSHGNFQWDLILRADSIWGLGSW
jgi:hypothetical protein